jgi:hypothetical protein
MTVVMSNCSQLVARCLRLVSQPHACSLYSMLATKLRYSLWQNVVEWLTLLIHIREVSSWNICLESGNPDRGFLWLYSVPPGECRNSTLKLGLDRFLPNHFQFIIHLSPFHSTIYIYIAIYIYIYIYILVWFTEKVSLNKLQINKN